jgi:hypothetical protein
MQAPAPVIATPARPGRSDPARYLWALTRLSLGWTFLWPFLDKLFGLGHETPAAKAWIHGGSPTKGFLSGAAGPFAGIYHSFAGAAWANWGRRRCRQYPRVRPEVVADKPGPSLPLARLSRPTHRTHRITNMSGAPHRGAPLSS